MAVKEAENPANAAKSVQAVPRTGCPALKQQTFDWKTVDRYQEPQNIEIEVQIIFMSNSYKIQVNERSQSYSTGL